MSSLKSLSKRIVQMMKLKNRTVYVLPLKDKFLIYAPFINLKALVNQRAALLIKESLSELNFENQKHQSLIPLLDRLKDSEKNCPELSGNGIAPDFLGIIPTRGCNCNCRYCDFGSTNGPITKMDYKTAVTAVDWYVNRQKELKKNYIDIHFFGGEPMLFPDIVEVVVHRARLLAIDSDMQVNFTISTNGLCTSKWAHFLGDYFNSVIISIDGKDEYQKMHRPLKSGMSSLTKAFENAKIISDSNAELNIRACISQKNVSEIEETSKWFCETFRPNAINFEILQESDTSVFYDLYSPDPFDFAINFVKSRKIIESYGVKSIYASDINAFPVFSSCPVGKDAAIVSPDGQISSCYLLPERWENKNLNLNIGTLKNQTEVIIDEENLNEIRNLVIRKPRCEVCFCRWSCAGGCHVENTFPGSSEKYNNHCIQTRIISICSLLEELFADDEITSLIQDKETMLKFINQNSDFLNDFN